MNCSAKGDPSASEKQTGVGKKRLRASDIPGDAPEEIRLLIEATFAQSGIERAQAAAKLGQKGELAKPAIPFLIQLLEDGADAEPCFFDKPCKSVNTVASESLSQIGDSIIDPCLSLVDKIGAREQATYKALVAVARIDSDRAADASLSLYKNASLELRRRIVGSWSHAKHSRFFEAALGAMRDSNAETRSAAQWVLDKSRDPRAVPALLAALKDVDLAVRSEAIMILGRLKAADAVPALIDILQNKEEVKLLREEAARSLGEIGDGRALDPLLAVIQREDDVEVRLLATKGLELLHDRKASPTVIKLLRDTRGNDTRESVDLRVSWIFVLSSLEAESATPLLLEFVRSQTEEELVRWAAALNLATITKGEVDEILVVKAITGGEHGVRGLKPDDYSSFLAIGEALEMIKDHGKTEAIREAASKVLKRRELRGTAGH